MLPRAHLFLLNSLILMIAAGCGHRKPVAVPAPPVLGGVTGGVPGRTIRGVTGGVAASAPQPRPKEVVTAQFQDQAVSKSPSECPVLIFECPGAVEFDKTVLVSVLIAPRYSEALGEKLQSDLICKDEPACERLVESVCQDGYQELPAAKLWRTPIAPRMTVSLNAPGFQVEHQPPYAEQDPGDDFAHWEWQLKPSDEGEDSRRISFEVYARATSSDAPRPIHLPHVMAKNVTVTGRQTAQVAKAATKMVVSGFTLTLGKLIQLIIGTLGSAAVGAYLKKKWPQLAAKFDTGQKPTNT